MIQKGILYTVDATTGKPTNIPIRNVWINFNIGNSIKARAQTDDKGSFSLDVPAGKYTVQLALGSTSPILRAGQLFEVKSNSPSDAFTKWLYSETGDINDALLQSFKAISNEVNANANRAEDAQKGAQNILNDMQSNSVGSGKWMKEGAYGVGGTPTHYNFSWIQAVPLSTAFYRTDTKWSDSITGTNDLKNLGILLSASSSDNYRAKLFIPECAVGSMHYRLKDWDTWSGWRKLYDTVNTTVDSNGFIKQASPIIHLFDNEIDYSGFNKDPVFEKLSTGVYKISNTNGLRAGKTSGDWYIELPKDRYGDPYFNVEYERIEDGVIVRVYEREEHYLPSGRFFESDRDGTQIESFQKVVINGKLIDLKEDWRCISLRFREDQYKLVDKPIVNLFKPM
ncbi:hypothetical protein J7624_09530 [Wohlfahrtiimonas chitiniclastica]|uniref:carboxypeptidase-like regulatory domain-containing protein n=1 Tax=Wohlfahrtiimonas chitiniclastica TaxID=400946 RepID=UPI001BCEB73D|nr:carboxypeptidase-like regulatory domain-containing protein [Wohlfahrtiimonas chitiniclastica]MBS7827382.1 hypothetical protein [Wohlfahrtiimonas chitiniclastica]